MKERLIDILHAVITEDHEQLARCFFALAIPVGKVNYSEFEADAIEIADRYLGGVPLSEIQIGTLFSEMVAGASRHNVRMPADFTMMFKAIVTTEGLAKSIAPDIDPLELARPFITDMVAERYSSERIKHLLISDFQLISKAAHAMPRLLPAILHDIQEGKLAVGIAPASLKQHHDVMSGLMTKVIRTALVVVFIASGTYCLGIAHLPLFPALGVPIMSVIFYVLALIGLLRVRG